MVAQGTENRKVKKMVESMNELVLSSGLEGIIDAADLQALLQTVEEVNTSSSNYRGKGPQFTDIRYVNANKWQLDDGEFVWSLPDNKDFVEELDNVKGRVVKLYGYLIHAQIGASDQLWDDSEKKFHRSCQAVGHKYKGEYLSGKLPDMYPLKELYKWDNQYQGVTLKGDTYKGGNNPNIPDDLVESIGLFGSKGMLCSECIKQGQNKLTIDGEVYVDPKTGKPKYCDISNAYIILALTSFDTKTVVIDKKNPSNAPQVNINHYEVSEVMDDNPSFVLLQLNLSKKLGLKGLWDRETKTRPAEGFASLCASLARDPELKDNVLRRIPYFNELSIDIYDSNPRNYLNFGVAPINVELFKEIQDFRKAMMATAEYVTVPRSELEPDDSSSTVTMLEDDDDMGDLPPLKTVVIDDSPVSDKNPFAE